MLATELRERGNLLPGVILHDRATTDSSRTRERKTAEPEKPNCIPASGSTRILETEGGARPGEGTGAPAAESAGIDRLTRKPLKVCWSLSTSQEHFGELAPPNQHTKDTVMKEAILWAEREREADKWKWLEV